jgi:predicted MFS family arabinose efflux permease
MKVSAAIRNPFNARSAGSKSAEDEPTELTRPLLIAMAVACGLGIANVYYNQPLLGQIGRTFHVSPTQIGSIPMLAQGGFAAGVMFLTPLGDVLERRKLIMTMVWLVALGQAAAALAPSLGLLQLASFIVGVTSVISTLVIPFAVSLCGPKARGATVGSITSAMLISILISRTFSGAIGQAFGWRAMFGIAAILMVVLGLTLRSLLPTSSPTASMKYSELIKSTLRLAMDHRVLRESTINGFLLYGALSAFWATLVFLIESPAYHFGMAVAGMFGLIGAASALFAPVVGKLSDRYSPRTLVGIGTLGMFIGYLVLGVFGLKLWGLILGVIILDLAAQSSTISNQTTVYSLPSEIHSRAYTVYRAAYSLGGAAGAWLGAYGWSVAGWSGVCLVGSSLIAVAGLLHVVAQGRALKTLSPASR